MAFLLLALFSHQRGAPPSILPSALSIPKNEKIRAIKLLLLPPGHNQVSVKATTSTSRVPNWNSGHLLPTVTVCVLATVKCPARRPLAVERTGLPHTRRSLPRPLPVFSHVNRDPRPHPRPLNLFICALPAFDGHECRDQA